mgnify:CR=1 FL=1
MFLSLTTAVRAFFLMPLLAAGLCAGQWNHWRGPQRNGVDPDSPALRSELPSDGLLPMWTSEENFPTGGSGGWSSPVVADGCVFVLTHVRNRREGVELPPEKFKSLDDDHRAKLTEEQLEKYESNRREEQQRRRALLFQHEERLTCFDAATGKQLWVNTHDSHQTRYAQSSSPAVVDGIIIVHGARGVVRAVDAGSGEGIWRTQLPGEFDEQPHPASVAVAGSVVVIVAGRPFGLDLKSGKLLWQGSDELRSDNSSPAVWMHRGESYVLLHTGKETACLSANDGREIWRVESQAGRSSPVVTGDRLITYGNSRKGGVRAFALSPERADPLWKNTDVADEGSSPVPVGEHLYVHGDRRLVCIDMADGKTLWRRELDIERPRYTSLVAAGEQVIFAAGGLLCFAADPDQYRLLVNGRFDSEGRLATEEYFRRELNIEKLEQTAEGQKQAQSIWRKQIESSGPAQCVSPALHDGRIYLRLRNGSIACYDLRQP